MLYNFTLKIILSPTQRTCYSRVQNGQGVRCGSLTCSPSTVDTGQKDHEVEIILGHIHKSLSEQLDTKPQRRTQLRNLGNFSVYCLLTVCGGMCALRCVCGRTCVQVCVCGGYFCSHYVALHWEDADIFLTTARLVFSDRCRRPLSTPQ